MGFSLKNEKWNRCNTEEMSTPLLNPSDVDSMNSKAHRTNDG